MDHGLLVLISAFALLAVPLPTAGAFRLLKLVNHYRRSHAGPAPTWSATWSTKESKFADEIMPSLSEKSFDWTKQWYPVIPISYLEQAENKLKPTKVSVLDLQLVIWNGGSIAGNSTASWSVFEDVCCALIDAPCFLRGKLFLPQGRAHHRHHHRATL